MSATSPPTSTTGPRPARVSRGQILLLLLLLLAALALARPASLLVLLIRTEELNGPPGPPTDTHCPVAVSLDDLGN